MAQLPPDGTWLMQQIGEEVVLFHRDTEEELVRFDPSDGNAAAQAQRTIHDLEHLSPEQKCFAHFWSGYFYAHAGSAWSKPSEAAKNLISGNVSGSVVQAGNIEGGLQL